MLPKYLYPHLNRQQRRHPNRNKELVIPQGGANWFLAGLLIRAGFWYTPETVLYTGRMMGKSFMARMMGKLLRNK